MEDPPSPSTDHSVSRRGSHLDPSLFSIDPTISPHPDRAQHPHRDSLTPAHQHHVRHSSLVQSLVHGDAIQMDGVKGSYLPLVADNDDNNNKESSPLMVPSQRTPELDKPSNLPNIEAVSSPCIGHGSWAPDTLEHETSKGSWYLFLLTMTYGGLQFAWSVELSYGSPYLLSLGISKALLAFVWIAGPLSGTLVQPYIGIQSDSCRCRFGQRRPFMVGGAIATAISLILLAWTAEIVSRFLHVFGISLESRGTKIASIAFAVVMIYILDFSINVVQAACRAFIVDNAPTHQQDDANAWAIRLGSVGNILGYLAGYVDLPRYFWWLGNTQFKILCVFACLSLAVTVSVSCFTIKERDPRSFEQQSQIGKGLLAFFRQLALSVRKLPPQIKSVCLVQFFAWIGWFPFLFYITTYIGEIHVGQALKMDSGMNDEEIEEAREKGTRLGTLALFIFAIATFASSIALPFLVMGIGEPSLTTQPDQPVIPNGPEPSLYLAVGASAADSRGGTVYEDASMHLRAEAASSAPSRGKYSLGKWLAKVPSIKIRWLTLRRTWLLSHLLFALLMWLTLAIRTTLSATILVTIVGVPWAVTNWVPFALIAAEISEHDATRRRLGVDSIHQRQQVETGAISTDGTNQAGVVLGIHNVAIAAPQVIATLISALIFRFLQKPRGATNDDSVGWVLRFGGVCALVAAWLTRRVFESGTKS